MSHSTSQVTIDTLELSKEGYILKSKVNTWEELDQHLFRYYRNSNNPLDQGKALHDTMFRQISPHGYMSEGKYMKISKGDRNHDSKHYIGNTNYRFDDSTYLNISKVNKTSRITDMCYQKIQGKYTYSFGKFNNLRIEITYNKDSLITSFKINRKDSTYRKYSDNYVNFYFPEGSSLLSDTTNSSVNGHMFQCDKEFVVLTINDKKMLTRIDLYSNKTWLGHRYHFNNNFQCITHGQIKAEDKKGPWKTYHLNGNIKSFGCYDFRGNDDYDNLRIKVGLWKYYALNGTEEKVENWKNGQIIPNN